MAAVNNHGTYTTWYPDTDVGHSVDPAALQQWFNVGATVPAGQTWNTQPATLVTFVVNHPGYKLAFLSLGGDGRVYVIHRVTTFLNEIETTPFSGHIFTTVGEVLPGGIVTTVEPEDGWLSQAWNGNDINVPTVDAMDALLAMDNNEEFSLLLQLVLLVFREPVVGIS